MEAVMLSKNNIHEKLRKIEPQKQRFSIRKFTVGAASVLIGFTFMGINSQTVNAETTDPEEVNATEENSEQVEKSNDQTLSDVKAQNEANASDSKTVESKNTDSSTETVSADNNKSLKNDQDNQQLTGKSDSQETKNSSERNESEQQNTSAENVKENDSTPAAEVNKDDSSQRKEEESTTTTSSVKGQQSKESNSAVVDKNTIAKDSNKNIKTDSKKLTPEQVEKLWGVELFAKDKNLNNRATTLPVENPKEYPKKYANDNNLNNLTLYNTNNSPTGEKVNLKDMYIYQVAQLSNTNQTAILARKSADDDNVYAFIITSQWNRKSYKAYRIESNNTLKLSPTNSVGYEIYYNAPGTMEFSGETINYSGSTLIKGGLYLNGRYQKLQNEYSISNVATGSASTSIGEILPNYQGNKDTYSLVKFYDKNGNLVENDEEAIYVKGWPGQIFALENVSQYLKVHKGYYLSNQKEIDDHTDKDGNLTGSISDFEVGGYYRKVYYDNKGQISFIGLYHQISPDGTMAVSLLNANGKQIGNTQDVGAGKSVKFDSDHGYAGYNWTARNPYVTGSVHAIKYVQLGSITYHDIDGNQLQDPTQYENATAATIQPLGNAPKIPGYKLVFVNEKAAQDGQALTIPENLSQDTNLVYAPVDATATIKFVDDDRNEAVLYSDAVSGKYKEEIKWSNTPNYENKGYIFVSSDYPTDKAPTYHYDSSKNVFTVHFKHALEKVDKDNQPQPGDKINSNDSGKDYSKYPAGTDQLTADVSRTIKYVYAKNNEEIAPSVVQPAHFDAVGYIDKVTGQWIDQDKTTIEDNNGIYSAQKGTLTHSETPNLKWSEDQTLAEVAAPTVPKPYKPSCQISSYPIPDQGTNIGDVKSITVGHDYGDQTVIVYYASPQTATITYRDITDNKQLGDVVERSGEYNEKIDYDPAKTIKSWENKGYVLVDNPFKPGTLYNDIEVDPTSTNDYVITLKHGVQPVNPENPGKPGEPINPNDSDGPKYPTNTGKEDLTKTATRTIHYVYGNGPYADKQAADDVKQTTSFTASGYLDKVTGNWVTVDEKGNIAGPSAGLTWTTGQYDEVKSPEVAGYSPDQLIVEGVLNVKHDDQTADVTVKYYANEQAAQIIYYDDTLDKELESESAEGKHDHQIVWKNNPQDVISKYEKLNYELVADKSNIPSADQLYHHDNNQNIFKIYLKHKTASDSKSSTVKRTITYVYEDGREAAPTVVQTLTFTGRGTKDLVTGELVQIDVNGNIVVKDHEAVPGEYTWTPDKGDTFKTVDSPTISGYSPDYIKIEKETVNHDSKDRRATVTYLANEATAQIVYIDDTENGKVLSNDNANGKFDIAINFPTKPTDKIASYESQGYVLVSNNFEEGTKFKDNSNDPKLNLFEVHLKHGTVPVTPDKPGDPEQPINPNDPNSPTYPADSKDLTKTVTRTINYYHNEVGGDKASDTVVQTLTFKGSGYVDKVTGQYVLVDKNNEIILGEDGKPMAGHLIWTNNGTTFVKVDSPEIAGYTASPASIPVMENVARDQEPIVENVIYTANSEIAKITYIDDVTGQILGTNYAYGYYKDPINFDVNPATAIKAYEKQGYKQVNPEEFTFVNGKNTYGNSKLNPTINHFEVHFTHETVLVGPNDPVTPDTPINPDDPDSPTYPVDAKDLTKEVTRTINYYYNEVGGDKASDTVIQKVIFKGTGYVDKVTGQLVQGPDNLAAGVITWKAVTPTRFEEVDSPVIYGYTPDKYVVDAVEGITRESPDIVENVVYTPVPEPDIPVVPTTIKGSQTIKFVDEKGKELHPSDVQTAEFTNSYTFGMVKVPVIQGYVATEKVAGGKTVTEANPHVVVTVVYKKIGNIIPVDEDNKPIPGVPTPPYKNDPDDPTKVIPTPVPNIPGYTPNGSKVTPSDPTKDTKVIYRKTKGEKPNKPSNAKPGELTGPTKGQTLNKPGNSAITVHPLANAAGSNSSIARAKKSETLPQTGEKNVNKAGIIGLTIATLGALFGLAVEKKRKSKEN